MPHGPVSSERVADDFEEAGPASFPQPAGWAAQYPPAVLGKDWRGDEGLTNEKGILKKGDAMQEDVEGHDAAQRHGQSYRQGSLSLDETSSAYSKKGSPSSNAASSVHTANVRSDAAKNKQRSPFMTVQVPASDAPPHIPGIPQDEDTCPSVWPAFLAPKGAKSHTQKSPASLASSGSKSRGPREPRQSRRDSKTGRTERCPKPKRESQETSAGGGRFRKSQTDLEEDAEAAFEAAAAAARHAAEEAAQAAKAAQVHERVAAQQEAQLKQLEDQLIAAKRRNEELEAAAAIAARREEELAVQAAEMQDLASQLNIARQRNQELEAAAHAAEAMQAAQAAQAAQASQASQAAMAAREAATAAWASARPRDAMEARHSTAEFDDVMMSCDYVLVARWRVQQQCAEGPRQLRCKGQGIQNRLAHLHAGTLMEESEDVARAAVAWAPPMAVPSEACAKCLCLSVVVFSMLLPAAAGRAQASQKRVKQQDRRCSWIKPGQRLGRSLCLRPECSNVARSLAIKQETHCRLMGSR